MRAKAWIMVGVTLIVAACGRTDGSETAPVAPAQAPAAVPPASVTDFARPINALGNEPFWALKIRPEGLTFSAPDREDLEAPNAGPTIAGVQADWIADAKGQPIKATLRAQVCQDGMSGFSYPFTATVEVDGKTLTGCAAYADAMPRE